MLSKLTERGDTIVEVLVAISVISIILAGGYSVTSASLTAERQSQERGIALGMLQSQLEALKSLSAANTPTANFCFDSQEKTHLTTDKVGVPQEPACDFNNAGVNGNATEPIYHIFIAIPAVSNVYTATATWDRAGGGKENTTLQQDKITLQYKLYQ